LEGNKGEEGMKKFLILIALVLGLFLVGCRPYMEPIIQEVGPNETAFLVALEGDTKKDQARMDSLDFYESAKVSAKRIEIPQRWLQTGRNEAVDGKYIPTMRLIKVDRSPVTRLFYSETGKAIGDKAGINVETKSSVGVTFGISLSARIDEGDTAKYLYYYNIRPLAEVVDKEIYGTITSILGNLVGKMEYEEMISHKGEIVATLQVELTKAYSPFGITIYGIGMYGGIVPDNPAIQKAIDGLIVAENLRKAAIAEVETASIKQRMTSIDSAMADVDLKRALASYIRNAGEKGISLVPTVTTGDKGTMLDLGSILKK
jgi:hypothetical protein